MKYQQFYEFKHNNEINMNIDGRLNVRIKWKIIQALQEMRYDDELKMSSLFINYLTIYEHILNKYMAIRHFVQYYVMTHISNKNKNVRDTKQ